MCVSAFSAVAAEPILVGAPNSYRTGAGIKRHGLLMLWNDAHSSVRAIDRPLERCMCLLLMFVLKGRCHRVHAGVCDALSALTGPLSSGEEHRR